MGEIANDIIEGRACALCGMYFIDPADPDSLYEHGYPVACKECYEEDCGYQEATAETF